MYAVILAFCTISGVGGKIRSSDKIVSVFSKRLLLMPLFPPRYNKGQISDYSIVSRDPCVHNSEMPQSHVALLHIAVLGLADPVDILDIISRVRFFCLLAEKEARRWAIVEAKTCLFPRLSLHLNEWVRARAQPESYDEYTLSG